ncbi:MAG: chloride channel protein [Bdellovibrionia bacterium]
MMLGLVLNGVSAAAIVCSVLYLQERHWQPVYALALTVLAALLQWVLIDRARNHRNYDGVADMIVPIHSPSVPETPARWAWAGMLSWCLTWIKGIVGPEGPAAEWNYAADISFRSRSVRWFEQRRRTESACVLTAAIAAAFNAPFAAVLVPVELGLGGRLLSTVICSLSATIAVKAGKNALHLRSLDLSGLLDGVDYSALRLWGALLAVGVTAGLLSALWLTFTDYSKKAITHLSPRLISVRILAAGIFLFLLGLIIPISSLPVQTALQDLFLGNIFSDQAGILFVASALSLTLVLIGFGTVGVFWPVFALGGYFGFALHQLTIEPAISNWIPSTAGYAPLLALAGGAAFWGAILDLPIASGVLIFELTGDIQAALLALGTSLIAQKVARKLGVSLTSRNLKTKGLQIVEGRSLRILQQLTVREAMVTDFETIHEQEPVNEVPARLLASKYPFLPVVRADGVYTGLVTVDMVQERILETISTPEVSRLFEVKDLLYSSGFKTRTLHADDALSNAQGMFQDIPCVPVLTADGQVEGLLFVHHVRLAYEREMARRSLRVSNTANEFHELAQP